MLDFSKFEVISFDCYGTLIDWETGILRAIKAVLNKHEQGAVSDDEILANYAQFESAAQASGYVNYRTILQQVMNDFANKYNMAMAYDDMDCLVDALPNWTPFPDTLAALAALKQKYKLAIISNIDDILFQQTVRHLQVDFDFVITAEQVKSYKPNENNFLQALNKMQIDKEKLLHVAQSLYHDIVPARKLGLSTVWVKRRQGQPGSAAQSGPVKADLEVADLKTLVGVIKHTRSS